MEAKETLEYKSNIEFEKSGTKIILEFLGGVGNKEKGVSLTGSATKLTIERKGQKDIVGLIDFGMFQGCEKELKYNEILPFKLEEIDFVILTHTHIDHIGKTLHFSKNEFNGTIWTSKINKDVLFTMLSDVIKLQKENETLKIDILEDKKESYIGIISKMKNLSQENIDEIEEEIEKIEEEIKTEKKKENETMNK